LENSGILNGNGTGNGNKNESGKLYFLNSSSDGSFHKCKDFASAYAGQKLETLRLGIIYIDKLAFNCAVPHLGDDNAALGLDLGPVFLDGLAEGSGVEQDLKE
jgi:hypothetical protein